MELTEFIKKEESLLKNRKKDDWDKKLKKLLAKSKTTTTINQPYLSIEIIVFSLLMIVYVPMIDVFKNLIPEENICLKVILVLLPILVVVLIMIFCKFTKIWKKQKKENKKVSFRKGQIQPPSAIFRLQIYRINF